MTLCHDDSTINIVMGIIIIYYLLAQLPAVTAALASYCRIALYTVDTVCREYGASPNAPLHSSYMS